MAQKAIILGITGLVGNILAQKLFEDPYYEEVLSFHRRKSGLEHPKLSEHVIAMDELEHQAVTVPVEVVFCCVGTTRSKSKDKEAYKAVDYGIPLQAARLCKRNKISKLIVISALGADAKSRIFYNRLKGEMERDVRKLALPQTYFFQPALLAGDRQENRLGERLAIAAFKFINPILQGSLKKYQSIKPKTVAKSMLEVAKNGYTETQIESDTIKSIAQNAGNRTQV